MKLPESFNLKIHLKQSLANAAGAVLFMYLLDKETSPLMLGAAALFGLCGGSINEIISWRRNRNAIEKSMEDNPPEENN